MSAVLREWIASKVISELAELLKRHEQDKTDKISGPKLRIRVSKGLYVQIISVGNDSLHRISDKTNYVEAEFSETALQRFREKHPGRTLFDLKGAVVVINSYDIATLPIPIRLIVDTFQLKGSEGSTTFGKPSDIMGLPDVQRVIKDVFHAYHGDQEDRNSPIQSQDGDHDPSDRFRQSLILGATMSSGGTQLATKMYGHQERPVEEKQDADTSRQKLLAALYPEIPPKSAAKEDSIGGSVKSTPKISPMPILKPVSEHRVREMTTKLDAEANKYQSQLVTHFSSSGSVVTSVDQMQSSKPIRTESGMPSSEDSEKENSQESLNRAKPEAAKQNDTPTPYVSPETSARKTPAPLIDMFQTSNPFEGLKRVPRNFVRISEAQQALLNRNDSWFEPNSDGRTCYAMIPPKIREELDSFLDRQPELAIQDASDDNSDQSADHSRDEESEEDEAEHLDSIKSTGLHQTPNLSLKVDHHTSAPSLTGRFEEQEQNTENLDVDNIFDDASVQLSSSALYNLDEPQDTTASGRRMPPAARPRIKMPLVPFDSPSSPGEEEEMELAVPHAVGDIIEEHEAQINVPETSQELPRTAPVNKQQIQIEPTPNADLRTTGSDVSGSRSKGKTTKLDLAHEDVFSDSVIPATFDNSQANTFLSGSALNSHDIVEEISPHISEQEEIYIPQIKAQPATKFSEGAHSTIRSQPSSSPPFQKNPSPGPVCEPEVPLLPIVQIPATVRKPKQPTSHSSSSMAPLLPKLTNEHTGQRETRTERQKYNPTENVQLNAKKVMSIGRAIRDGYLEKLHAREAVFDNRMSKSPVSLQSKSINHPPNITAGPEVRITSTYMENSVGNDPPSKENIPVVPEPRPHSQTEEQPTNSLELFLREAFEVEISPELDSDPTEGPRADAPISASQVVVDLRSPSPEDISDTNLTARTEAPLVNSQALRNLRSPSPENDSETDPAPRTEAPSVTSQTLEHPRSPSPKSLKQVVDAQLVSVASSPAPDDNSGVGHTNENSWPPSPAMSQIAFFDEFKATYADYDGSRGAFTRAVVYLEWLQNECGTTLKYCDDFIRFMESDYKQYLIQHELTLKRGDVLTGFAFYNRHILKPVYTYHVVSRHNIQAVLLSLDPDVVATARQRYLEPAMQSSSTSILALDQNVNETETNIEDHGAESSNECPPTQKSIASKVMVSRKDATQAPKRRFFETASQQVNTVRSQVVVETPDRASQGSSIRMDGKRSEQRDQRPALDTYKPDAETPNRASPGSSNVTSRKTVRRKTLPWVTKKSNDDATSASPKAREPFKETKSQRAEAVRAREYPVSPILGSLRDASPESCETQPTSVSKNPLSYELEDPFIVKANRRATLPTKSMNELSEVPRSLKRKRTSGGSPSTDLEDPFFIPPKPSKAARRATMPAGGNDNASRVKEWVRKTPVKKRTFKETVEWMKKNKYEPKSVKFQKGAIGRRSIE